MFSTRTSNVSRRILLRTNDNNNINNNNNKHIQVMFRLMTNNSRRRTKCCELFPSRNLRFISHTTSTSSTTTTLNTTNTKADYKLPLHVPTTLQESSSPDSTDNDDNSKNNTQSKTAAYLELAKARLSALVVTTTMAGFIAAGGPLYDQASLAGCCVVGTALCSSSAAALNQIYERDRDAMMKRTLQRPLVTGTLSVSEAKLAAVVWGVTGTTLLAVGTDPITTMLGLGNIGLYAGLYTYMKPRSIYNTWVGAIVGAIPPVIGWSAATSGSLLDFDAIILGSTLYLWQLPHFFALSYMYKVDYQRGGFQMLSNPESDSDGERTSSAIMRYATYLSVVPFISTFAGVTSSMFALEGIVLNSYALYVANKFRQERTNTNAKKVFFTSLWYLPSWLILFLLHSKVWDKDEEQDRDILRDAVSGFIHSVRNEGRKMCIHEQVVVKTADDNTGSSSENACPVALTKKGSVVIQSTATSAIIECERNEEV
ncbi:MAG: protoheme IX farnesyltransferase [Bacillariaceae sp.]|jgi:protoheme IX farnesyltransferase